MMRNALAVLIAVCIAVSSAATSDETESINAYIAAAHERIFKQFNVLVLGDLSVAKAAFRGAIAVQGKAELADFDVGSDLGCDKDFRAVTVGKTLNARMGSVNGGYTVVGRGSKVHHSVSMKCSNRVEQYDSVHNGDVEFSEVRRSVLREAAEMCVSTPTGTVESANETLRFVPGEKGFSCYTFFKVSTDDLRLVQRWEYAGDDYYRNIVIVVSGLRSEFRDLRMHGFNPRRTLIVFCAVYGSFELYNAKVQASVLAPTASITTMDSIVNGSLIIGALRGSLATLNVPYVTC
ncbi:hypothetical protein BWQ96_00458 [Gracilariopsis chorda]|uniref:Choice-of-anchor A domain-containing protein n=1 Tax=Gracilariopsis chorda TaxID=448386 RepID=A0A2V3J5V5_9FLOR|nr:hypothetical protein BWQ96_00458 [Gracilariopsis chorda]|eukprot:PXF49806.1 hypothetical protein BWQ96_00458 [Gracilariopsis chorda]